MTDDKLGKEIVDEVAEAMAAQAVAADTDATQPKVAETQQEVEIKTKLLKDEELFIDDQQARLNVEPGMSDLIERTDDEERINALPRNLLTFQQILGIKPYYVPKKENDPEAIAAIFKFAPIRPSRFPDKLHKDLTGHELSTNKMTNLGMRERMGLPVGFLREVLSNMAEFRKTKTDEDSRDWTGRLQIVPRKPTSILGANGIKQKRGAILTSRAPKYRPGVADDESFEGGEKKHYALVGDLDKLIRSHLHAKIFYASKDTVEDPKERSELSTLIHLKDTIQTIIEEIQKWKGKTPEEKEALSDTIRQLKIHVAACTNQYKVEIDRLLLASWRMKDSAGKTNPGAKAAQIVKALNQDLERFRDAVGIEHTVNRDYESLRSVEEELTQTLTKAGGVLEQIVHGEYFKLQNFSQEPNNAFIALDLAARANSDIETSGVIEDLQAMVDDDGCPAPYPQVAQAILTNLQAYMKMNERIYMLTEEELDTELGYARFEMVHREACKFVLNAELTMRYVSVNETINEVLNEILTRPFNMLPGQVFEDLNGVQTELNPKTAGEDFDIKGGSRRIVFEDPNFKPTSNFLDDLKRLVQEWAEDRMFARENHYDNIRRFQEGNLSIRREELDAHLESLEEGMRQSDRMYLKQIREQGREFNLSEIAQSMVILPETAAHKKLEKFELYRKDGEVTASGT